MNKSMNDYNKLSATVQQGVFKFSQIKELLTRMVVPMTFQKGAIMVGLVLCILSLILLATAFYSLNETRNHPPHKSDCPDYFIRSDTDRNTCTYDIAKLAYGGEAGPTKAEGTGDCGSLDLNTVKTDVAKLTWAKECGVQWDGITNNYDLKP